MHHLELKTFSRNTNCVHNIHNSVAKALDDREKQGICACIHWESLGHIASFPNIQSNCENKSHFILHILSYEFFCHLHFNLKPLP
jgi:hypothetical protein